MLRVLTFATYVDLFNFKFLPMKISGTQAMLLFIPAKD